MLGEDLLFDNGVTRAWISFLGCNSMCGSELQTSFLTGSNNSTQPFSTSRTSKGVSTGTAPSFWPLTTMVESCSRSQ